VVVADKAKPAKRAAKEIDVDDFLNGGFMSMDAQQDQLSDSGAESEDEGVDADAAGMDSDVEQDAHDLTSAAADAGSDSESDGALQRLLMPCCSFAVCSLHAALRVVAHGTLHYTPRVALSTLHSACCTLLYAQM